MTVRELFSESSELGIEGEPNRSITGLCYDSRLVEPGALFFAISGEKSDGHQFIQTAIEKRAGAVVLSQPHERPSGVTFVRTHNVRRAMGSAASAFYAHPSRSMTLVGITGTNGKTTTSYLLESIWRAACHSVGVIGTINYRYATKRLPATHTTPESVDLQGLLAEMRKAGVTHVVVEVSSHALAMERVRGLQLDGAVFTNLSRDHLDFHKDLEEYFYQKSRLFDDYLAESPKPNRFSVINEDDPRSPSLVRMATGRLLTYGMTATSMIHPEHWERDLNGLRGSLSVCGESLFFSSSLVGKVNLYNILAAATAAWASGISLADIQAGIERLKSVPGRMERIEGPTNLTVVVDYAHTPDALEKALQTLRPLVPGRILTIFGCGGDRDRGKRPLMGWIAARLSDLTVLTSDNPRSENPNVILNEIEEGSRMEGISAFFEPVEISSKAKGYIRFENRKQAISTTIRYARPDDTILIAGKGHEDTQIVGAERNPFDDREEARKALMRR
jgi:UDP-N-acetylmuramoyl-L-alanyl-D-glutamate--2,6-diaminopimelate ligase